MYRSLNGGRRKRFRFLSKSITVAGSEQRAMFCKVSQCFSRKWVNLFFYLFIHLFECLGSLLTDGNEKSHF